MSTPTQKCLNAVMLKLQELLPGKTRSDETTVSSQELNKVYPTAVRIIGIDYDEMRSGFASSETHGLDITLFAFTKNNVTKVIAFDNIRIKEVADGKPVQYRITDNMVYRGVFEVNSDNNGPGPDMITKTYLPMLAQWMV